MKTNHIYVTLIFISINYFYYAQEDPKISAKKEKIEEPIKEKITKGSSVQRIEIDAKYGRNKFTNSEGQLVDIDFVKKGNRVEVHVINLSANQQPTLTVIQEDVRVEGDQPTAPINPADYEVPVDESSTVDEMTVEIDLLEEKKKADVQFAENDELDNLYLKVLKLRMISVLKDYSNEAIKLVSEPEKNVLIENIQHRIADFHTDLKKLKSAVSSVDYTKVKDLFDKYNLLIFNIDRLAFDHYFYFTPEKEKVKINIELNTVTDAKTENRNLYSGNFTTRRRAIIYGSVGMHGLFYGGNSSRIYSNKDSLIVSGKGNSITPSFGTYLNIGWRGNDFIAGFGIGTGIPINIDGSNDLTPNFSVFGTLVFPGTGGRLGVNVGIAMRRGEVLAPGYTVGENLGGPSIEVPMINKWSGAFMAGLTYNLVKP